MERNHDWPLISSKKQTHLICFGFRPIYEEFLIGTATFVNHRPITVKADYHDPELKLQYFPFHFIYGHEDTTDCSRKS